MEKIIAYALVEGRAAYDAGQHDDIFGYIEKRLAGTAHMTKILKVEDKITNGRRSCGVAR